MLKTNMSRLWRSAKKIKFFSTNISSLCDFYFNK